VRPGKSFPGESDYLEGAERLLSIAVDEQFPASRWRARSPQVIRQCPADFSG
jgi:hypothetical protein